MMIRTLEDEDIDRDRGYAGDDAIMHGLNEIFGNRSNQQE